MKTRNLSPDFFLPRSVALVGASGEPGKVNSRAQQLLRIHGFTGKVFPINPRYKDLFGLPAYPTLLAVPEKIDHALIMVPAPAVHEVVRQCCERQVAAATIFSSGFAELGEEGAELQRQIVATARDGGVRLLGPNCLGLVNVPGHTTLSLNAVLEQEQLRSGPLSVISQSGSMLGALISRAQARGLGFSKLVSVGNECDIGVGEIAELLADDADTGAILLFLEAFRDSTRLAVAARRAFTKGKPVIAYKLGRSEIGRRVAVSHTGAIAGAAEVSDAFFQAHGIMRVDTMESLFELPQLVMGHKPPAHRRVAILTGSGGPAGMIADRLGTLGVEVAGPTEEVIRDLNEKGVKISASPVTDIPMGRNDSSYNMILSALLSSDHCDAVISVSGSSSQTNPQKIVDRVFVPERSKKPLAVFLAPRADEALALLGKQGIAGFRTPEACADSMRAYLNWRSPQSNESIRAGELAGPNAMLAATQRDSLNECESLGLFSSLGIPSTHCRVVSGPAEAVDFADPVAVKILSPDIVHKTEAGMVALNVVPADIASVVSTMLGDAAKKFPKAGIDGILVQRMESGLAEVIVGYRRDPEVGPIVLLGLGGIAAEVHANHSVRVAPVSLRTAETMVSEIPQLKTLAGFRNLPRGDCTALAHAIRAMSLLALVTPRVVSEAEINPLIVKRDGEGVVAVDGLVVLEPSSSPQQEAAGEN